jgi:hypothetical protein
MAARRRLQTVAETKAFAADIDAMLSAPERDAVIAEIAAAPDGGDLIRGTGGLRKRRIALPGRGKRGGARVITLFLGERSGLCGVPLRQKRTGKPVGSAEQALLQLISAIKARVK